MNKLVSSVIVSLFISAVAFALPPKNVILFIGDGMSTPQRMVGEEFSKIQRGKILRMNHLEYQATTRTCSSSSLITDSAAAATAIACGVKTKNRRLGMDAHGTNVQSVAEFAKARGMKVITLTGGSGGKLAPMSDIAITVPAKETYQVQELHLPVYHTLCAMLEARDFES